MTEWRPNWRDAEAYPVDRTESQWRWEFLRRRDDYQADFAEHGEVAPQCREKYGVGFLIDPANDTPPPGLFEMQCPYGVGYENRALAKARQDMGIHKIAFDVDRPLEPQLRKAKQHLQRIQKENDRNPRERRVTTKWPLYLRVLDAKAARVTNRDIAIALELEGGIRESQSNADRLVGETLKAAREVQERFILFAARDVEVRFKETPEEQLGRLHKEYMKLRRLFE